MKHIIFDLDGTLIDSSEGIYKAFCAASLDLNLSPPSSSDFRRLIGPPVNIIYQKIFNHPSKESFFVERFRFYYDTMYFGDFYFYDSLLSTLHTIIEFDYSISIVTNKPTSPSLSIISNLPFLHRNVNPLIGFDFFGTSVKYKTSFKTFSILYISNLLQIPLSDLCYVGDTLQDYHCSAEAGVRFIGCKYGFDQQICTFNSFPLIDNITSLPSALPFL